MAILAGAIAPALIKYIDKSRKSNDVSSAKTIKTAIETALGNEKAYEEVVKNDTTTVVLAPTGVNLSSSDSTSTLEGTIKVTIGNTAADATKFKTLVGDALGNKIPKIKYKKTNMDRFEAHIDSNGNVEVGVNGTGTGVAFVELTPEVADSYQ
jgi:type IV pilus assembly protein PilA